MALPARSCPSARMISISNMSIQTIEALSLKTLPSMRHTRADLSKRVTHLIRRRACDAEPLDTLYKIACDEHLNGSSETVIGQASVICFSEAPESEFTKERQHFSPFGISIDKSWFFAAGGRPVIYQPKEEHQYVDPTLHWKLVSFDPCKPPEEGWIDWSWQREWRIQATRFYLPPEQTIFVVPSEEDKENLLTRYQADEDGRALYEELVLCLCPNPPRDFPYPIKVLPSR